MGDLSKKRRKAGVLIPSAISIKNQKQTLPNFEPINLQKISGKKRGKDFSRIAEALLLITLEDQAKTLLTSLNIEVGTKNCWQRGFLILARLHHGAGQLEVGLPNLNAKKWTEAHDRLLCSMVLQLTRSGATEDRALKTIADDPSKWGQFPTHKSPRSSKPDKELRFIRLQHRWKQHSKNWTLSIRLETALGISGTNDETEHVRPPPLMVKNKSA